MKRLLPLLLALLLLLAACERAVPAEETTAETSIEITTTEEPTTEETTTTRAAVGEVAWRLLENTEAKKWIDKWNPEQPLQDEYPMGKNKTILRKEDEGEIVLRDNATGKETPLLKNTYTGDEEVPPEDTWRGWKGPKFIEILDERYFLVHWVAYESVAGISIYDTQELRDIPVSWDEKYESGWPCWFWYHALIDDDLYLRDTAYGEYDGPLHLMRVDLTQLDSLKRGEAIKAVNLLADIPHEPAYMVNDYKLTQNGRYFAVTDYDGLYIFDVLSKALLTYLPKIRLGVKIDKSEMFMAFRLIAMRDDHTLYWFDDNNLVEIILP